MRFRWLSVCLAAMATALPAAAQDVVGSTIVEGRSVQLLSDFTWKYASQSPSACQTIENGVSFCGKRSGWTQFPPASADVAANYRLNDRSYGLFIVEEVGSDDGVTPEAMRNMVVENAASAGEQDAKDIRVLGPTSSEVDGLPGETITYFVKMDQMPIVFTNTIVLEKHRTVQVVTYGLGAALTEDMKANHARFLAETRLK